MLTMIKCDALVYAIGDVCDQAVQKQHRRDHTIRVDRVEEEENRRKKSGYGDTWIIISAFMRVLGDCMRET